MKRGSIPKPDSIWEWLLFLSPAVTMIIFGTAIPAFINATHPETGQRAISSAMNMSATWGTYGMAVAGVLCLVLGFRLVRREEMSLYKRLAFTLAHAVVVGYINLFVAFAGCIAVGVTGNALSR